MSRAQTTNPEIQYLISIDYKRTWQHFKSALCKVAFQTKTKHDSSVKGGLVKIAEQSLVSGILLWLNMPSVQTRS